MSYHPGKFTWFEHVSTDSGRARTFYEGLFGWKVQSFPIGPETYEMVMNADQGIGGLNKAPAGRPNHWASYLSVDDVDARFAAAVAAGAKPLMPPTDVGGVGRGALIEDPTGALMSLWHSADGDRDDAQAVPAGDWCWNELTTPDPERALAFYEGVFGYTHDVMDMGPAGKYYIVKSPDGKSRGGVCKPMHPGPAQWMPYVEVEDADKTAARVAPLGGQLTLPPHDVPGVGRICILVDPLGAQVGFITSVVAA